jgi:hypothetical protein
MSPRAGWRDDPGKDPGSGSTAPAATRQTPLRAIPAGACTKPRWRAWRHERGVCSCTCAGRASWASSPGRNLRSTRVDVQRSVVSPCPVGRRQSHATWARRTETVPATARCANPTRVARGGRPHTCLPTYTGRWVPNRTPARWLVTHLEAVPRGGYRTGRFPGVAVPTWRGRRQASGSAGRKTSMGTVDAWATCAATLPRTRRDSPPRPWVVRAIIVPGRAVA